MTIQVTKVFSSLTLFAILLIQVSFAGAETVLIKNVSIVGGKSLQASSPTNVLIKNNQIVSIGNKPIHADVEIDATGQYLIPGLIDTHVHLEGIPGYRFDGEGQDPNQAMIQKAARQVPRSYLYFGFTTLLDLGAHSAFIDQWNSSEIAPEAYYCTAVVIPNGYPVSWLDKDQQFSHPGVKYMLFDERQAAIFPDGFNKNQHTPKALAARIKADGGNCIKVFYETGFGPKKNLPVPTVNMVKALVSAAHDLKLPVYLHGNSQQAYEFALQVGVDTVVHGMWHWSTLKRADTREINAFADKFSSAGIAIQPTIQVLYGEQELFNSHFFGDVKVQNAIPEDLMAWYQSEAGQWMVPIMRQELPGDFENAQALYQAMKLAYKTPLGNVQSMTRALAQRNTTVLFGSDTPSGPFYTQFPGINGRLEMDRWLEAGLSLELLFKALTINNAKALGLEASIGSVEVGKKANLLLLKENPLKTITAYDSIQKIILNGKVLERELFSARYQP